MRYFRAVSRASVEIKICRICGGDALDEILDLGDLALTGVFLPDGSNVPKEPLKLIRCIKCGLVQLAHNFQQSSLYTSAYGYESHLNTSMIHHLHRKARILEKAFLKDLKRPIVVDIASNDGTFLSGYARIDSVKIGVDPLIDVFSNCYPEEAIKIQSFFSKEQFWVASSEPANLVTSLSVIYDLEDPIRFARDVSAILAEGGIWHFEQSYLPSMLATKSFDTICHEHLLYLSLRDISRILSAAGMQIIDASLNSTNGGSIAVTAKKTSEAVRVTPFVNFLLQAEDSGGITDGSKLSIFASETLSFVAQLRKILTEYKAMNYEIFGMGASTKGNVILQTAGLDGATVSAIAEVNPRKFGLQTPGSCIDIVSESILQSNEFEKLLVLVLPWHFRENLMSKIEKFIEPGKALAMFPLPQIEIVSN